MSGEVYQEQSQAYVAYKFQDARGEQAAVSGANVLLTTGGAQGALTKAAVASATVRQDGMSLRGRHGTRKTAGAYSSELFMGQFEDILEAVMRGTWSAADLAITNTDMTSVTTGANTIVAAAGSWITKGLRVGQVVRATGLSDAANNGKNIRIVGLTALTITTAETLVVNATPDTSFTITRPGRVLVNPAMLIKRYCTIDEYEIDIDGSEVYTDAVWGSIKFAMAPNGMVTVDTTWTGTGQMEALTDTDAPYFTTPTQITDEPLAATGATLRMDGVDVLDLTAFDITIDIGPTAPDVIAPPSNPYSPDVFAGSVSVSINFTTLRKDLEAIGDLIAETPLSLQVMFAKDGTAPQDFLSIAVPNFTLGTVIKSALSKAGGARTVAITVPAALVGIDTRGGAFDPTMLTIQTSLSA